MNDLQKSTLTTLEVAEMMETEHKSLLRKLEGDKSRKGYISILTEHQMSPSDYFMPSSYRDASGKENKCYEVTKLGCDFLANKFTGEKGILFTARYVKRFDEMEKGITAPPITEHPGEVANLLKVLNSTMRQEGIPAYKIAENTKLICNQYGINLIPDFIKHPAYEQIELTLTSLN